VRSPALTLLLVAPALAGAHELDAATARRIGERLWLNEGKGRVEALTAWNAGEGFPSLGIGHFVWYPADRPGPYTESFPALLAFMASRGASLPSWLSPGDPCPWPTRARFLADRDSPRLRELRAFLAATIDLQTSFVLARLEAARPTILDAAPLEARARVRAAYERLAATSEGLFALADYVNFKGEGTNPKERRQGRGWGLLQVLRAMDPTAPCAVEAFARAARQVLTARVEADPTGREHRWLLGWRVRVDGYRRPLHAKGPPPCRAAVLPGKP
jgi:hypothetical protein